MPGAEQVAIPTDELFDPGRGAKEIPIYKSSPNWELPEAFRLCLRISATPDSEACQSPGP